MTYKLHEPSSDLVCSPNHVRAAYAAGLAEGRKVSEGWKLVPMVPTAEMLDAAQMPSRPGEVYAAMLTAAPEPKP